ncbi:MFS transporter [Candidatus Poribacteria bacterium]|nr:MFS transporter [Candidatus Poribacteria bacterium]
MNDQYKMPENWGYLSQISLNYLGWFFCWTVATSYMMPNALLRMVDDSIKNTRLGLMAGAANVLLLILLPLVGTLSDRSRWRIGRRRPFYLLAALSMVLLASLVVRCRYYPMLLTLLVAMHAAEACWFTNYALLRDVVPLSRRGRISGLTNVTGTLGVMFGHILSPWFIGNGRMLALALIAGGANLLSNLWVAVKIREKPPVAAPVQAIKSWREIYFPTLRNSRSLIWLAASNLLTQMGAVAMLCFLMYFIKDQIDSAHFNETYRNTNLLGTGAGVFSALTAGWIADRFGRKRVLVVACLLQIWCMANFVLLPWVHSTLYLSGFLFGLGNAAYWSIYWTLLSDLVPEGETSKYIGLIQYTSMLPWAVVPATLGPIVDNFGAASGRGYSILFSIIIVILIGGMILVRGIPETLKKA